jgi:hypothetical protein
MGCHVMLHGRSVARMAGGILHLFLTFTRTVAPGEEECFWSDSDNIGIVIVVGWVESIQNHCVALMDCMDYEI